ncbi:hypothetical protein D3C83_51560 [compost metagenome]
MRHAAPVVEAVLLAAALRGVDRLVHRRNDIGHRDVGNRPGQAIAAARAAHAVDELGTAQLAEQLLQVGQRNVLALADRGEGHRTPVLPQSQIDHRGDREASFGSESHGFS